LSLVEQASSSSTQTSKEETANQTINIIRGIKEYLKSSDCNECKKALLNIFFKENDAGSLGGKTTEAGSRLAEVHSTNGIREHQKI
jgi:hypothetical protein